MKLKPIKIGFLFLTSAIFSYTIYEYGLQPGTFFSKQRIFLAILGGLAIFSFLLVFSRLLKNPPGMDRSLLWGLVSTFLLLNLLSISIFNKIPYPRFLLPTRTVEIRPAQENQVVKIKSFKTELIEWVDLDGFAVHEGWESRNEQIINQGDEPKLPLIWVGKPGKTVEVRFAGCTDCGAVNISWGDGQIETLDLTQEAANKSTLLHEYPSLIVYQLINLATLEFTLLGGALVLVLWGNDKQQKFAEQAGSIRLPKLLREHLHTGFLIAGLALLTFIVYALKLQSILFNDDWSIYYYANFDLMDAFMLDRRRPLHLFLMWLFNQVFPPALAVKFTYGFMVVTLFLTAVMIYLLACQLLENRKWFALLIAGLFLVFPSDYTRLYMTMADHRFAFLLMLVAMYFSVKSMQTDRLVYSIAAAPLLAISLLVYEGQLGLLIVWPAVLAVIYRKALTRKKLLSLGGYYVVAGLFFIWRLWVQPRYFFQDSKLENIYLSPWEILSRYFYSLKTILIGFRPPFPNLSWLTVNNLLIIGLLLLCLVGFSYLVLALCRSSHQSREAANKGRAEMALLSIGIVLWGAGYFPILLNYPANIYGHISRINLFSVAGAVLILLTLIHSFISALSRNSASAAKWTTLLATGLIFFGGVVQLQSQESYNRSWIEKKAFFQTLFEQVPNVKPDTHFVFLLEGYGETSTLYRPLFSSSWEALTAIRIFYNQQDLLASYQYDQITVPKFPDFNILPSTLESESMLPISDPETLIVMRYNRLSGQLSIEGDAVGLSEYDLSDYSPYDRILPLENNIPSREIVE